MSEFIACHVCGGAGDEMHEPIHGSKYRKLSIKYDLRIPVCRNCHELLHKNDKINDVYKKEMQLKFEAKHGFGKWMEIFGRNYVR